MPLFLNGGQIKSDEIILITYNRVSLKRHKKASLTPT